VQKFSAGSETREHQLTEQGIAFSQASLTTVTRRTADRVLREFLDRVLALNADEDALYQVPEAVIFGSYLTNAERLGDVDLAIEPVQVRMSRDGEILSARPTWRHLRSRSRTLALIELDLHREWLSDKPHEVILTDPEVVERGTRQGVPTSTRGALAQALRAAAEFSSRTGPLHELVTPTHGTAYPHSGVNMPELQGRVQRDRFAGRGRQSPPGAGQGFLRDRASRGVLPDRQQPVLAVPVCLRQSSAS
jgi:hypothetical protein